MNPEDAEPPGDDHTPRVVIDYRLAETRHPGFLPPAVSPPWWHDVLWPMTCVLALTLLLHRC